MLGDSLVFARIASAMASRRTLMAASFSTPKRSQKNAMVGISGILIVGAIHCSSWRSTLPEIRTTTVSSIQ
jgi:hypothetical protein